MNYLLDTSIVAPAGESVGMRQALKSWLVRASDRLFLSVVTLAEIERGSLAMETGKGGTDRSAWLELMRHLYSDRFLPLDIETARLSGNLLDKARRSGAAPTFEDAAIAATASRRGLTIVTTRERHFRLMDVHFIHPQQHLPDA